MDEGRRTFLAYQIMSGIKFISIAEKRYKLIAPSRELKLLAEHVYLDTISPLRFDNLITTERAATILLGLQIWTGADDAAYKKLETHLEDRKIDLYESLYDKERQKRMRRAIEAIKKGLNKAVSRKHSLDYMTLEYHAQQIKYRFIIALGLRDEDNQPIYTEKTFWNADSSILEQAISILESDIITVEEYRAVARNDPWRTTWTLGKEACFGVPTTEWTDDQKMLATFAKMYDNAYQSMECPPDEVFEDDDMFDGWLAQQRRKREKEQKQKTVDTLNNIPDKAQEVFVNAPTRDDADRVYALNDQEARATIKQRQLYVEKHGTEGRVEAEKMPDTQLELRRQQIQEYKDKMRGGAK